MANESLPEDLDFFGSCFLDPVLDFFFFSGLPSGCLTVDGEVGKGFFFSRLPSGYLTIDGRVTKGDTTSASRG